jgi:hypothetical protein
METISRFLLLLAILLSPPARGVEYGHFISADSSCALWWAEGTYKIMKNDPVPGNQLPISISSAGNEYEAFQLVLRPPNGKTDVAVRVGNLLGQSGRVISSKNVSVKHVAYVNVTKPTDSDSRDGEWPDPLPDYGGPFTVEADRNHPLWIRVFVPSGTTPGSYRGEIELSASGWRKVVPFEVLVWSFSLPRSTHLRSSFGLSTEDITTYHNLRTPDELRKVTDLYYQCLRDHRMCPTSPFDLYPIHVRVLGLDWEGGEFVNDMVHSGRTALKVVDESETSAVDAHTTQPIPVLPGAAYDLSWFAIAEKPDRQYTVIVKCYDSRGSYLPYDDVLRIFRGSSTWEKDSIVISPFRDAVKSVSVHLMPTSWDLKGTKTGTAFFDDVVFRSASSDKNLLPQGDFEVDLNAVSVNVDFSAFDPAARRYLDEFGFNSFNLRLEGLGWGSFYQQRSGVLHGFPQGTPEYDRLMGQYLSQVEKHLEQNGWLGKEYIYWFDEPNRKDYPFVREGMMNIRRAAPKLTRFITEHQPGPDIMDVSEISCTIFDRVDREVVAELTQQGREFWSYLCTAPKAPWVSLFIDHDAINLRIWPWMSYQWKLKGILIWRVNYWNSPEASPAGTLQNPWVDPMSYMTGYGTANGQIRYWGNGDGRLLYPPNRNPNDHSKKYLAGPVCSVRLENLRDGIEDYEYFHLLEEAVKNARLNQETLIEKAKSLLDVPESIFSDGRTFTKDPQMLLAHRKQIGEVLGELMKGSEQ